MDDRGQVFGPLLPAFPDTFQGGPGFQLILIWDPSITGSSSAHCITLPAPFILFFFFNPEPEVFNFSSTLIMP